MKIKLHLASLFTLFLLSGMVLSIILAASYFLGYISAYFMIIVTIVFNLVIWLLGPYISDIIYKIFYKINFYKYEQIKNYPYINFIKRVCDEHNIKVPKIGIINDLNPIAFTYGSASFNARIVLTEGMFKFLDEKELESVVAHEIGHIVHKDFIVMSIASTLLQLLYEFYFIFTRTNTGYGLGKRGEKRKGNPLVFLGIVSYIFYCIGTYILLYLSRIREYYADEFSSNKTGNPNLLSSALIKVAYGIMSSTTDKSYRLLNESRTRGIFDFKTAKETALIYQNSKGNKNLIERALLFDIVNPWAFIYQLSSTHPLIGKRIKRLSSLTQKPAFNFESIIKKDVNKKLLWKNFLKDILIKHSTLLAIIFFMILIVIQHSYKLNLVIPLTTSFFVILIILSIVKIRYKFPKNKFTETNVINCMADVYASPVRGKPVVLKGRAIGRGRAGFIFGEDMMFQDKTGIIYLNYESIFPFLGNLMFAWKKLENLLMKPAETTGWFLRGSTHHIELYRFYSEGKTIKSYARYWMFIGFIFNAIILVGIALFLALK